MGRRPERPEVQAAKARPTRNGDRSPGNRKLTVKGRQKEAKELARLLAETPVEAGNVLEPPKFLDGRFPAALQVWKNLAPILKRTHRLKPAHKPIFAMFCFYYAELIECNEDIAKYGKTQNVPTVSGGSMERFRPSVKLREVAMSNVMALSARFGLTPRDEYDLMKDIKYAAEANPDLFKDDGTGRPKQPEASDDLESEPLSQIGSMASMDSAPPAAKPH